MTDIDRLKLAAQELADIQEDVSDDAHRDVVGWGAHYFRDALDEIERLSKQLVQARAALQPLAHLYSDRFFQHDGHTITFGDIRAARAIVTHTDDQSKT